MDECSIKLSPCLHIYSKLNDLTLKLMDYISALNLINVCFSINMIIEHMCGLPSGPGSALILTRHSFL